MKIICTELLLVLVDFLEVLVGVNLEFAACSFVAGNDSVRVHLESGDGPCVVNAAFYAVTESACLVVAADEQENLLGVTDGADADGESGLRNLVGVIAEEAGVDEKGVFGQRAYAGAGNERGEGFVERDVAVNAGAAHEEVDAAVGSDLVFITLAFRFEDKRASSVSPKSRTPSGVVGEHSMCVEADS